MNRLGISFVTIAAPGSEPPAQNNVYTNGTTSVKHQKMENYNKNVSKSVQLLKEADIVCFDVDSTVITEEGIDELAKFCGKGDEVAKLTRDAMGGDMTFQDALRKRLNIIRPTQGQIREFLQKHPSTITPGLKDLISKLKSDGKQIYLVTGGFSCVIEPVAKEIGIPLTHVYANKLFFYFNGEYAGFDTNQPTSCSGGKGNAIDMIRRQYKDEQQIVMIGDGATDMEAAPKHANNFIGFGGNVVRDAVQKHSQYYVTDFHSLLW